MNIVLVACTGAAEMVRSVGSPAAARRTAARWSCGGCLPALPSLEACALPPAGFSCPHRLDQGLAAAGVATPAQATCGVSMTSLWQVLSARGSRGAV